MHRTQSRLLRAKKAAAFSRHSFSIRRRRISSSIPFTRALHGAQIRLRFRFLTTPDVDPVTQVPRDPGIAGDLGDGLAGLEHHLHGLSFELRTELPPLLRHGQTLPGENCCPRSSVHPGPRQPGVIRCSVKVRAGVTASVPPTVNGRPTTAAGGRLVRTGGRPRGSLQKVSAVTPMGVSGCLLLLTGPLE